MMLPQHSNAADLMRWATYASVTTALILIFVKIIAWFITDSVSVLATLLDSSLDVLASALNLIAVTGVLWLIYVATRFSRYLGQAALGNLPGEVIFTLLGYSSLGALSLLLPIGAFLAVLLALGRMNSDSELTVIASCGIPNKRVIRNVAIFSISTALIVAMLSLAIVPNVLSGRYELEPVSYTHLTLPTTPYV